MRRWIACLIGALSLLAVAPVAAQAATLVWEPSATLFWTVNQSIVLGVFMNGQCTQWAAEKRPDVIRRSIEATVARELATNQTESMPNFDAMYWTQNATQAGIATGHRPVAGALIVFQPGVLGAGSVGHIAYVQRVNRNGSFRISEMHAPVLFRVTYETLPASVARLAGVSFIYR